MLSPFRNGVCRAPLTLPFCLPAPRREKEATRSSRCGWNVEDADGGRRRRESGWQRLHLPEGAAHAEPGAVSGFDFDTVWGFGTCEI